VRIADEIVDKTQMFFDNPRSIEIPVAQQIESIKLQQIQGVSNEQVGSQILALQTRMQASMQTTALIFQTSLVNYLR